MDLRDIQTEQQNYSGQLILAHPALKDPNFEKTVVLISVHSDEGTLGIVLNRPTGKLLSEVDPSNEDTVSSDYPVFYGGPVATDQIIVVAWQFIDAEDMQGFKLFFGITLEKANELTLTDPETCVQCYLGHSGWGKEQLDNEMKEGAWVSAPMQLGEWVDGEKGISLWKKLLANTSPEMKLIVNVPDDPSVN